MWLIRTDVGVRVIVLATRVDLGYKLLVSG